MENFNYARKGKAYFLLRGKQNVSSVGKRSSFSCKFLSCCYHCPIFPVSIFVFSFVFQSVKVSFPCVSILYNNVYKYFFHFYIKKGCQCLCRFAESAYLCTRKRETTAFATMFFELLLTRQEKRKCSTRNI